METKRRKIITNHKIIITLIIMFIYNAFKFINDEGSEHPLVSSLFNMIIFIEIPVIIFHRNEIDEIPSNTKIMKE